MKAVRYFGPGQPFQLVEVPIPDPQAGEVLVRIRAAGMCHTELHFESGLLNLGIAPLTMGHEIAGTIEAVGAGGDEARIGERVLVYYYVGCGSCEWCKEGDENLCGSLQAEYGFFNDGGYAQYIAVPDRNAVTLPDTVSFEAAAPIGCGVTTAVHACRLARVASGQTVVVYGVGSVGYGLIQVAGLAGARVLGVGRTPAKLRMARELGAADVIEAAGQTDIAEAVREATGGRGADVVFELVASAETMAQASSMLAKRGRLVFIRYSEDTYSVHPIQLVLGETIVTASVGNTFAELEHAARLVADGRVRTVVDRALPLGQWEEGYRALKTGSPIGRVLLVP